MKRRRLVDRLPWAPHGLVAPSVDGDVCVTNYNLTTLSSAERFAVMATCGILLRLVKDIPFPAKQDLEGESND